MRPYNIISYMYSHNDDLYVLDSTLYIINNIEHSSINGNLH